MLPPPAPPYTSLEIPDMPQMYSFALFECNGRAQLLFCASGMWRIPNPSYSCSQRDKGPALKPNPRRAHINPQQGTYTWSQECPTALILINPLPPQPWAFAQRCIQHGSATRVPAQSRKGFVIQRNCNVVAEEQNDSQGPHLGGLWTHQCPANPKDCGY